MVHLFVLMPRGQPRVRACLTFYSDCVSRSLLITPCPNNTASTSAKRPAFGYYIFANIVCVQKEHIRTTAVPWAFPNLAGITEAKIAGDNKDNKPLTSTVWCRVVSHFSSHSLRFTWIPWRSTQPKGVGGTPCRMPSRTNADFVGRGQGCVQLFNNCD